MIEATRLVRVYPISAAIVCASALVAGIRWPGTLRPPIGQVAEFRNAHSSGFRIGREGKHTPPITADYERALRSAEIDADPRRIADFCGRYGNELMRAGELAPADMALSRAYFLRKMLRLPGVADSLVSLSNLRLAQHDPLSALNLAARAADTPEFRNAMPPWTVSWAHAQAEVALERRSAALADLRAAVRSFRASTAALPSTDAAWMRAGDEFRPVYDRLIQADMSASPRFAEEAFFLSEEFRSISLRHSSTARHDPVESIPWERSSPREALSNVRRSLRADEAFLSFYLGAESSWLWVITRSDFFWRQLPRAGEVRRLLNEWRQSVRNGAGDEAGRAAYRMLLGDRCAEIEKKFSWVISGDEDIFKIPFAAMVVNASGPPVYLVERHATRLLGGPLPASRPAPSGEPAAFVGIGDGIYNAADERAAAEPAIMIMSRRPLAGRELPRLPSSGQELRASAAAWNGQPSVLLTGPHATCRDLSAAVGVRPAVLHIAAHVLHASDAGDAAVDLGGDTADAPQLLTAGAIAGMHLPEATVAMSGCASVAGDARTRSGTVGLTRAWLLAGARAVVGTAWSASDDDGPLFAEFYRHLRQEQARGRRGAAARAMQSARLQMLRSRSWMAAPAYWASFQVIEKE